MTELRPRTESELVEFMHSADARAPESLHRRVEQLIAERGSGRRHGLLARTLAPALSAFRPARLASGIAVAVVAAVALALVLSAGNGARSGPSLRETASLTVLGATAPAPAKSQSGHAELVAAVDGISFPYWEDALRWRSTGARSDRVGGRSVTTVFYANWSGSRVGYAIVPGRAPAVAGGVTVRRGGVAFRLSHENGRLVVSWLRSGHLCVISGTGVDSHALLRLASWEPRGSVRA